MLLQVEKFHTEQKSMSNIYLILEREAFLSLVADPKSQAAYATYACKRKTIT